MERVVRIELTFPAWKAGVLPIYDTRIYYFLNGRGDRDWTCDLIVPNDARSQLRYTPIWMVRFKGFEPPAHALEGRCSIQLS